MNEQIQANSHPDNQLAKQLLAKAGEPADPKMLYSLQLARWVLEEGEVEAPAYQWEAERRLAELEMNDQEEAWKELTDPMNGEGVFGVEEQQPLRAALEVWAALRAISM